LSSKQRGKLVREIAAATHTDLSGNRDRQSGGACATEICRQLDRTCSQPLRSALGMIGPVDFEDRLSQTAQAA
jgi:hypothetical protein